MPDKVLNKLLNSLHIKKDSSLRWGIIGTGHMARLFAGALNNCGDNKTDSVLSRSAGKASEFAEEFDIKHPYSSLPDFLKEDIDVVYIATPLHTHYDYIKSCLEAGKNILCEKPIVCKAEELRELKEMAGKAGCFLMEGMWSRLLPTMSQAKEWIDTGLIGEIKLIRADKYKRKQVKDPSKKKGVLYDYGIYAVSFIQDFLKDIAVEDFTAVYDENGIDTDRCIKFISGESVGIANISSSYENLSKACILGSKGSIVWDSEFNRTNTVSLFDSFGKLLKKKSFEYSNEGFEYEIQEVCNCIKSGKKESPRVSLNDSIKCLELMQACEL